jgi:hypothetical protein
MFRSYLEAVEHITLHVIVPQVSYALVIRVIRRLSWHAYIAISLLVSFQPLPSLIPCKAAAGAHTHAPPAVPQSHDTSTQSHHALTVTRLSCEARIVSKAVPCIHSMRTRLCSYTVLALKPVMS